MRELATLTTAGELVGALVDAPTAELGLARALLLRVNAIVPDAVPDVCSLPLPPTVEVVEAAPAAELPGLSGSLAGAPMRHALPQAPTVAHREIAAQLELRAVLDDIARRRVHLPREHYWLPKATLARFDAVVPAGLRPFATIRWVDMLELAGALEPVSKQCVSLSTHGCALRRQSPVDALAALFATWRDHPTHDESLKFCDIGLPRYVGRRAYPEHHDEPLTRRWLMMEALRTLPEGAWVASTTFVAHLAAHGLLPRLAGAYVIYSHTGREWDSSPLPPEAPDGGRYWIDAPACLAVVIERLALFGAVDAAWVSPSGTHFGAGGTCVDGRCERHFLHYGRLTHLRLTSLGAAWRQTGAPTSTDTHRDARLDQLAALLTDGFTG